MYSIGGHIFKNKKVAEMYRTIYGGVVKDVGDLEYDYHFCEENPIIFIKNDIIYPLNPKNSNDFLSKLFTLMNQEDIDTFKKIWELVRKEDSSISPIEEYFKKIDNQELIGDELSLALEIISKLYEKNMYVSLFCTYRDNEDGWCTYQNLNELDMNCVNNENQLPEFVECEPENITVVELINVYREEPFNIQIKEES